VFVGYEEVSWDAIREGRRRGQGGELRECVGWLLCRAATWRIGSVNTLYVSYLTPKVT